MPDKHLVWDTVIPYAAGAITNILHKVRSGHRITIKNLAIELALAACVWYFVSSLCDAYQVSLVSRPPIIYLAAWFGSRLVPIVERKFGSVAEKAIDNVTDRLLP